MTVRLLPSNVANAQIIRWDNKGITGNYTIQFSRDSGSTWTTIASNIANNLRHYTWQNLSDTVSTAKALIKISAGIFEDVSDQVFSITKYNDLESDRLVKYVTNDEVERPHFFCTLFSCIFIL